VTATISTLTVPRVSLMDDWLPSLTCGTSGGIIIIMWEFTPFIWWMQTKGWTIQPKLDRTDPVKLAPSESAIQYRSDTDSDLPWTGRKYAISKRKCKTLHKWCGARNSAVSGWRWLLSAVNQSRTPAASAVYWTLGDNGVSQSLSACDVCASNRCGPRY